MAEYVINSDVSLQDTLGNLRELYRTDKHVRVKATVGTKRSLDQNAIGHAWYEQVARELREGSALDAKCESKLVCGVPILRAEDADFRQQYDGLVKDRFTYEEKLELMKWLPVTSLMTKAQESQYLEAVQAHWAKRGVHLTFPDKSAEAA